MTNMIQVMVTVKLDTVVVNIVMIDKKYSND